MKMMVLMMTNSSIEDDGAHDSDNENIIANDHDGR